MQIAGFARYIRYAIFVGRNIEIVFKRSRQGLLRFETVAFRQVQDWLIALLELCAISVSLRLRMYWPREWPVSFLTYVAGATWSNLSAQTLFPATGAIPGYPRSTTKYYG